ncbi:hypothetical protein A3860_29420 [Niastella vici]|uniref:Uncharacterized protein n=1 Tax=Niastella vici TaxID=1703345 RepID=A0A1V9FUP6_9BACT|nr:hypothetical protein A3860_29420 [Niastella vici]
MVFSYTATYNQIYLFTLKITAILLRVGQIHPRGTVLVNIKLIRRPPGCNDRESDQLCFNTKKPMI